MSSVVKFFAAERAEAVGALSGGPDPALPTITYGNFDAEEALLDWEARLTGRSFEELVEADVPEVVAEDDDGGALVLLLSDTLVDALVATPESGLGEIAGDWAQEKTDEGWRIDPAIASEILRELAGLASRERGAGKEIYCWTA